MSSRRAALVLPPKPDNDISLTTDVQAADDENNSAHPPLQRHVSTETASPIELAVVWVEKARKGSLQWFDEIPEKQMQRYRWRKRAKPVVHVVMFLYLCLALFEQPSWCLGDENPCANLFEDMPSAGFPVAPFEVTNSLEICCLLILVCRTWLRWSSLGGNFSKGGWSRFLIVLLTFAMIDCVVAIFNVKGIIPGTFRLARLCRPLIFLSCYKHLRQSVARVVRSIPKFMSVLVSLGICVMLFSWFGLILFARSDEGMEHFHSWGQALASMWILFTTANNPDVWLPAYDRSRWSFLFFCTYLLLSLYLINNVLLAAVYDSYKDQLTESVRRFYENRKKAVEHAFRLLAETTPSGERRINENQFAVFFSLYCDGRFGGVSLAGSSNDSHANIERGRLAFRALDEDQSGLLSKSEFKSIVDIFHDTSCYMPRAPRTEHHRFRRLRKFMMRGTQWGDFHITWDKFVDIFIFVDIVLAFICTVTFMSHDLDAGKHFSDSVFKREGPWYWTTFVFTCCYVIEVNLKLWTIGFENFCESKPFANRFDLAVVHVQLVMAIVDASSRQSEETVRLYVLCRIFRVFRLLVHIKPLRQLAHIMMKLVPTYRRLSFMLLIVLYTYATIGEQVFGGLVRDNDSKLDGSAFAESGYWSQNFNDFLSGMVTLFNLMIVNNWFVIADAFLILTGSMWSQVFFVSFFVIVNLVVLNIMMALILDCFDTLHDDIDKMDAQNAEDDSSDEPDEDEETPAGEDASPTPATRTAAERDRRRHENQAFFRRESVLRRVLIGDGTAEEQQEREERDALRNRAQQAVQRARPLLRATSAPAAQRNAHRSSGAH